MTPTPIRHIRVSDEEWEAWAVKADHADLTLSAWIRSRCNGSRCGVSGLWADEITEVTVEDGVVSAEISVMPDEG